MHSDFLLPLRIRVLHPPRDVVFAVQRGRTQLLEPCIRTTADPVFDFAVRVGVAAPGACPRLLGPFTQGPPTARFVYVNSGVHAGQPGSRWDRRAKVPLGGITAELIQEVERTPGSRLETAFNGTGADGGPTCATVKSIQWRVTADAFGVP